LPIADRVRQRLEVVAAGVQLAAQASRPIDAGSDVSALRSTRS
jgi:hypothetical protein